MTALVVALGGTSYAVVKPSPRSVGAKELKRNAVAGVHIKSSAVSSVDVKDNALTGRDIAESSLESVPRAALADRATTAVSVEQASRAAVAAGLDRVVYRVATASLPPAPAAGESTTGTATARCDPGQLVVGGGAKLEDSMSIVDSFPDGAGSWTAHANNDDTAAAHSFTVFAVCVTANTPG